MFLLCSNDGLFGACRHFTTGRLPFVPRTLEFSPKVLAFVACERGTKDRRGGINTRLQERLKDECTYLE